jgi:RNA-directed DNA polymerase
MNYYGNFYKSALYPTFQHLNHILTRWATRKIQKTEGT